jgi:hypothetical protein
LYRLDRVSLAETARLELPSPPISVVTAAGSVWVGTEAGGVYRVDPGTARVVSQFATGAEVISIAVDPTGRALYLSENGLVAGSRITRRDLNGRVVASFDLHGAGPGRLAVAADGIWSSYPTGMMNSMVHLVGPNLRIGPTWDGQTHDGQPWPAQRFEVQVATGMVWVTGSMGPGAIECIDPATGVAKGGIGFDQTGTDYVAADRVYQLAPSGALQSAPMPAACHP